MLLSLGSEALLALNFSFIAPVFLFCLFLFFALLLIALPRTQIQAVKRDPQSRD